MIDYANFEKLLELKGVTASDVSNSTGIARSIFTDWKKGRYTPKLDKLEKMADYFGVNVDYFAGVSDEKTENKDLYKLIEIARNMDAEQLHRLLAYFEYFRDNKI